MDTRPLSVTLGALGGDPREALVRLSRLGSAGVGGVQFSAAQTGLRPRDLDRMARRGLRERLRQLELAPTGIDLWIPPGHFADGQHADRVADAIRDAIDLAAELDRIGVSLSLPGAPATAAAALGPAPERDPGRINAQAPLDRPGVVTSEAFAAFVAGGHSSGGADDAARAGDDRTREIIATMLGEADRKGVDLIDHGVPPRGDDFASHQRLRIGIDPAAWLARGGDPILAVARHVDAVAAARICDLNIGGMRAPVADEFVDDAHAERQLDVLAYAAALSVGGSTVPLIVDARQWPDPWAGLTQTAEVWARATG